MPENAAEIVHLREQATALAGGLGDLAQRASVYHHLYEHSGGNHCFPLLAAHGALWASGYFRTGLRLGRIAAGVSGLVGNDPKALVDRLQRFADAFRDINRLVCVETFFIYQLTARPALRAQAEALVPSQLLIAMDRCHAARATGHAMNEAERRALFEAFFRWEQTAIVGPAVTAAFQTFDWPPIKALALRPAIRFAYLDTPLRFHDFGDAQERIALGLTAFDRAVAAGWRRVEQSLTRYGVMPSAFLASPATFFRSLPPQTMFAPA